MSLDQKQEAIISKLRRLAQLTGPGGREPDAFVNATTRVRLGRAMAASDDDVRHDLERSVDKLMLKLAFAAADMMGEPPIGTWCGACQCYTALPARKMSCYLHE